MFFVRAAFWLTLVIALIPVQQSQLADGQRPVSPMETAGLIKTAADDLAGFCERNASACETGRQLAAQMGAKAREGARIAYHWLDDRYGEPALAGTAAGGIDETATGSTQNALLPVR